MSHPSMKRDDAKALAVSGALTFFLILCVVMVVYGALAALLTFLGGFAALMTCVGIDAYYEKEMP